jgi:hypothetical protein
MGLEVSRLARNNADWHRLLEICALTETLILDEDGLYDCAHFNDRLVLGLKGTMSEAELHVLRARLRGGILNKARRGELACGLPIGFTYDANGSVVLDPDRQIQQSLRVFFTTFRRTGSALGTVKAFRAQGLLFPRRVRTGARRGELLWEPLVYARAVWLLHNPRYAGAFFFGRTGGRGALGAAAPGRVVGVAARHPRRLHRLGGVRRKPAHASRKRAGRGVRSQEEPAAGRPGAAAGVGGVRALRRAHDGALPPAPRAGSARLRV